TLKLLEYVSKIPKNAKIICLVSGGGSASLCKPLDGIDINDYLKLTKNLILSEIPIYNINAIRGYFSGVKNGKLANLLYPRKVYNLIVSDDPKNIISSIGSGATVYNKNNYQKVFQLLKKKKIKKVIPKKLPLLKKRNLKLIQLKHETEVLLI
ncbi:glycerate-2-kinase family protein, partial [Candidatus Pelagibacter ubique]|nr:glycerate-2-kinase family protein [Candidatus Pelagibacter ubique]